MRSLFLRVFLWFWLILAAAIAVIVFSSPYWTRFRPQLKAWEQRAMGSLALQVEAAVEALEREGVDAMPRPDFGRGRPGRVLSLIHI